MAGKLARTITLPAPAKLNLFLHITGQRSDGYHQLQTVFQLLDYGDRITLTRRDDNRIQRVSGNESVPEQQDLVIRAAQALKTAVSPAIPALGVDIAIEKVLPMGGGIGGGSSDAATVLLGLNHLWDCHLSPDQLASIALELGADVPVFVKGHSAWAEGVGEQLKPLELPQRWYLVIHPGVAISTAELFSDEGLTRDCDALTITRFLRGQGSNVFEPVARRRQPEVGRAIDWLSAFSPARLTGSGSCLFAAFEDEQAAQQILRQIPPEWQGFVARGVNQSPVFRALEADDLN